MRHLLKAVVDVQKAVVVKGSEVATVAAAARVAAAVAAAGQPVGEAVSRLDTMVPEWLIPVVTFFASSAMVFGGVVPFIPQYLMIRRTRSYEGFNTMVCFSLLTANILRILFWFGHPFELPLLAQSVLMVSSMLYMMHACVDGCYDAHGRKRRLHDWNIEDFWKWTDYADYLLFVAVFTVFFGILTWLLVNVTVFIECLGFAAVFIEAVQAIPQWYRNHVNKSTQGMSVLMVASMTCGDLFKTGYFIARSAPLQFAFCGSLQVCVDLAILLQVYMYKDRKPLPPPRVVP